MQVHALDLVISHDDPFPGYIMTATLTITPKHQYTQYNYQNLQDQYADYEANKYRSGQANRNGEVVVSSYNYKTVCMATFSAIEGDEAEAEGRREYQYNGRQSRYSYRGAAAAGAAVVVLGAFAYTVRKRRLCTLDELCAVGDDEGDVRGDFGAMEDDGGKPTVDVMEGRGSGMKKTLERFFGRRKEENKRAVDEDSGIFY
jgi:hypothetical protein